jgi:hypothetical protein
VKPQAPEAALTRGNVTQPQSADPVERFVAEVKWRFAKTMPTCPHWYVMKQWNPGRGADFMELVRRIFDEGRDEQWAVGTPSERTVRYYYSGKYKYRVMDPTIEATDLINRARIDGKGPADGFEF